ncbi:MAG: type II toxin-antitoxin system VapC family toxin [Acidobacteria bacterium]|jgi:predicted nucleic acid-binding protein|nr:type II toxin-antitoxin system VapC family toxin [Acidobacteriota bacterium]
MALTIVDSDILIDVARGDSDAINYCQRLEKASVLAVSTVTQLELIVGCRNKTELKDLEKFLNRYQILKITDQISDRAVDLLKQYFLSHGLLIADGLIAATALVHNEAFVSKNQRDFRFIAGLNLSPYPLN